MPKIRTICLLFFVFSSACAQAYLAPRSPRSMGESPSCEHEAACQRLIAEQPAGNLSRLGQEFYAKAFVLTFDEKLQEASEAAECAAHLALGQHGWKVE